MKCCCNSNRTQYERNRSLKYLVLALAWTDNGATLPLLGLWLNASKSETVLDTTISPPGIYRRITIASAYIPRAVLNELWNDDKFNILGDKSFADDLNLERGIVRCREVLLPRSAEIHPLFFDLFNYVCMYTLKTSMHIYLIGPPPPNLQSLTQSHTINTCTTTQSNSTTWTDLTSGGHHGISMTPCSR